MNKKIAVLMTIFNGEKWLENQISSILSQREVDVTIYVSLDISTDKSREILDKIASFHKNIIFLKEGVFGSAGKNFYELIKNKEIPKDFDYYCLADQDDIWLDEKLSRAITKIEETASQGYSSNVTAFWPSGEQRLIVKSQPQTKWDYLFEAAGPGCTYVLSADLYQRFSEFISTSDIPVEKFEAHDWMIYAFARSRNFRWVIDESSYMLYRQHASNQVGANRGVKAYVKRVKLVLSGLWFLNIEILIDILNLKNIEPARLLIEKKSSAYFMLASMSSSLRRKNSDKLFLKIFFIFFSFKTMFIKK